MKNRIVSRVISGLTFMASFALTQPAHARTLLVDFSSPDIARSFRVINDDVMGGVSNSRLRSTAGAVVFEGEVSLENNGGFASFRGPIAFPQDSAAILLTVRGDGQRYKLTLKLDDRPGTAQYQAMFVAPHEWQTLRFTPSDFIASLRGRPVTAPTVRLVDVHYAGVLISDQQAGAFSVEIRDIETE
jgi:NADH dehydrogenase [ubiquinone] 1 alpha subcomplex assembly factor 1